jgi:hypothetical protein
MAAFPGAMKTCICQGEHRSCRMCYLRIYTKWHGHEGGAARLADNVVRACLVGGFRNSQDDADHKDWQHTPSTHCAC